MGKVTGYILRLSEEREELLSEISEESFAEPVAEFEHSRNVPLIGFVFGVSGKLRWIAKARRGMRAGTGLSRLNLKDFQEISDEIFIENLINSCAPKFKKKLEQKLTKGGLLPQKTFQEFLGVIEKISPAVSASLSAYSEARNNRIKKLDEKSKSRLAEQKEAVATSMELSGMDRDELLNWDIAEEGTPSSFLDGLTKVRLREDQMVINDSMVFPGFNLIRDTPFNSVVFESDTSKLTVLITNRQPLEKQLGVDLIYYNETFHAFLMIQYKAMEKEGDEYVFRYPNPQLNDELRRMNTIRKQLRKIPPDDEADSFRFSSNPFFMKLCPRLVFDPDNSALVKGMYIPLDYWHIISKHNSMKGPKGGMRISYSNARRYLDNTSFSVIASNAWIGTTKSQSKQLELLIRSTLEAGREIVYSIAVDKEQRHAIS